MDRDLAQRRGFLLDIDGTFFLGERLLDGALEFIALLERQGKKFLFLTNNSSLTNRLFAERMSRLGLKISPERILTSGEATVLYLQSHRPGAKLYLVGTPALEQEFRAGGFDLEALDPELAVLGFDTTFTYQKLWRLCDLVRAGLPYLATHPDPTCVIDDGLMPDIGAVIAFVKTVTGREPDLVIGKPSALMAETAAVKLDLPVDSLAMVGDYIPTDIALARNSQIPSVLMLTGETRLSDLESSPIRPDYVFKDLCELTAWLSRHTA
jgi:HAD superfamily hydrolase (TIGR01450 family)